MPKLMENRMPLVPHPNRLKLPIAPKASILPQMIGVYLSIALMWVLWVLSHYVIMLITWVNLIHLDPLIEMAQTKPWLYGVTALLVSGYLARVTMIIPVKVSGFIKGFLPR